jgi:hypothetical protein
MLTPECFCIPISNKKCVTQIIMLTKANESNCRKRIAKKFEMMTIKYAVPTVKWIVQPKVGTK